MKVLVVFVVVASLYSSNAMPFNDCRDHYDLCGKWAKHQYCELSDYKDYMSLVCPYSCGACDDILNDLSASGKEASGTGDEQKVIPEVDADFDNFEELGRISPPLSDKEADHKDEELSQSLSGSGEEKNEPLFRASATQETESRFHGEVEQQDGTGDQQESISGSGGDSVGVNFWPVVRIALDTDDGGSDREHHVIRRSEISTPEETTKVSEKTTKVPEETTTRVLDDGSSSGEATSGEKLIQRSDFPIASGSGQDDVTSGEDDAPFDTSSADLESDSGCSSGYGCYESQGQQGGDGGDLNSRSLIAKGEESVASGSASGDSTPDVWLHPHFDVAAGPYDDVTSGSGAAPLVIGSEDEQEETDVHEIEDAIFETGIPLQISRDTGSGLGSGIPSPPQSENYDDSETSGMGSGAAERDEAVELFTAPQQQHRMNLMEKLIKLGKLQAIKITHETVGASSRNEVPRVTDEDDNTEMQSDLGKGMNVTFVLNQDFHSGYANENSAAYNILANSVKKEVERALGSKAVVSEISFSEVREPAQSPRFSKVLTSLKLLGDVTKLEKDVKKGMISNLVVDKTFFHAI